MSGVNVDRARSRAAFEVIARHGVCAHRSALGLWFVSLAHDEKVIDETIEAVRASVANLVV